MGQFATSLDGHSFLPSVEQLCSQHLLITGQTGSGKTTTTLTLLSQLQQQQSCAIVFDPTGEYGKLPNAVVYQLGTNAYLDVGQLTTHELLQILRLPSKIAPVIRRASDALRIMKNLRGQERVYHQLGVSVKAYQDELNQLGRWSRSYPVQLLPEQWIEEMVVPLGGNNANYQLLGQQYDQQLIHYWWMTINAVRETMATPDFQHLFGLAHSGQPQVELNFVLQMFLNQQATHKTLVIDLSKIRHDLRWQQIVLSVLFGQILNYRLHHSNKFPVHLVVDEAHRYLPDNDQLANNGIFRMAREGRKCHLSLILTTQSPLDLPVRLRSQFNHLLVHHLVDQAEMSSLNLANLPTNELGIGEAFVKCGLQDPQKIKMMLPQWWQKE